MAGAAAKRYRLGTHRVRPPEETWRALEEVLPRVGVSRVAEVTGLDRLGVPVFQAVRPGSRNLSVSQGKGLTPAAARVSAAMEAVELWHAERLGHLVRVALPLREMQHGNPVRTGDLPWLAGAPLLDAARLEWIPARSLGGGRTAWLPRDLLELDFTLGEDFRPRMFFSSSNGLASGNCREEALLHALCEVIERHALHLAESEPGRRRPLSPESVGEGACAEVLARIRAAGMKASLYDVTWEVGVPAIVAEVVAPDLPNVWLGAGCHPAPEVALSRALTEAAQSRLTYISGARDDLTRLPGGGGDHRTFEGYAEARGPRRLEDLPDLATADLEEDLVRVVARLVALGHEPFWVDLSRPEIGLPVVRVFVPGLKEIDYH